MNKITTWLVRVIALFVICGGLITYLNVKKKLSLLFSEPSIGDLRYEELDKKRANAEFASKRDFINYEKFGSIIFCQASFNSWIESSNYSKQMDLYIFGKESDLSKWDIVIKDYENERSKCRDFDP